MAYDPATGNLVLFGGISSSGYLSDTWTYQETVTVPSAPRSPKATASNQQVALKWTRPSSDGYTAITGYIVNVYLGATPTGTPTVIDTGSTKTSYRARGLTNGQEYTFTIQAVNVVGAGPASPAVHATPEPTVPSAPGALKATGSSGQVKLTWKAPLNTGGDPITSYYIFRSTTSGSFSTTPTATVGGSTLTYTDAGLTNGTTDYYVVEAVNTVGASPKSKQASATP
jgi:hypothetical protein